MAIADEALGERYQVVEQAGASIAVGWLDVNAIEMRHQGHITRSLAERSYLALREHVADGHIEVLVMDLLDAPKIDMDVNAVGPRICAAAREAGATQVVVVSQDPMAGMISSSLCLPARLACRVFRTRRLAHSFLGIVRDPLAPR